MRSAPSGMQGCTLSVCLQETENVSVCYRQTENAQVATGLPVPASPVNSGNTESEKEIELRGQVGSSKVAGCNCERADGRQAEADDRHNAAVFAQ